MSRQKNASANSAPRLSIVVATRNAARTLDCCLSSTIEQTFTDWELLLSDAGSTDGTVELVKRREGHIAWWRSEPDAGIYDAWNQALTHARGDYVCFLGADDVWNGADAIAELFLAVGSNEYDLVTSRGLLVDSARGRHYTHGSPWSYRSIGPRMPVCHPGMLHKRSLFDRFGKFDTRYRIAGDLDFLLRLPPGLNTLHVDATSVVVDAGGVSREDVLVRLREQRDALARCKRYGPIRAYLAWLDKRWRLPIASLLGIPH